MQRRYCHKIPAGVRINRRTRTGLDLGYGFYEQVCVPALPLFLRCTYVFSFGQTDCKLSSVQLIRQPAISSKEHTHERDG